MKDLFEAIDKKLREKYWYNEHKYRTVKRNLLSLGLAFIMTIIWYLLTGH